MTRGSSHHDHIIKTLLGHPATAATFLRERLPSEIVALMTPDLPVLLPGSFIDSDQRDSHTDLLYRIGLRSGGSALAQVLIENVYTDLDRSTLDMLTAPLSKEEREFPAKCGGGWPAQTPVRSPRWFNGPLKRRPLTKS